MTCAKCGAVISSDEAGLTRKLVNRGAVDLFCFDCLGAMFHATRAQLDEMIRAYREAGCTLFI